MLRFYSALCLFALLNLQTTAQTKAAEHADWIVRAKYVVTMDAHHRVIDRGAVAIRGARVVGVGLQNDISQRFEAKHTLDEPDALLAPDLIDTHTHAPMSLFRALADDKRLED